MRASINRLHALWFVLGFVFFAPWAWSVWVCTGYQQTGRAGWLARALIGQHWWANFVWISVGIGACFIAGTATALTLNLRSRLAAHRRWALTGATKA
jgi:hypothetical protein